MTRLGKLNRMSDRRLKFRLERLIIKKIIIKHNQGHHSSFRLTWIYNYRHKFSLEWSQSISNITPNISARSTAETQCIVAQRLEQLYWLFLYPIPSVRWPRWAKQALTHPVPTVPVGHQHADEDEEHEDTLDGQHAGPEQPGLLHPAGGAVLTAQAARPARQTDGHVRVTRTAVPVTPVHRAAICTHSYANPCEDMWLTKQNNLRLDIHHLMSLNDLFPCCVVK